MYRIVIPARYGSTRFPAKVLALLDGVPMAVKTHQCALKSQAREVVVATDDQRVVEALAAHGIEAMMTDPHHPSGTDRLAEVAARCGWSADDVVVNLQADEPLTPAENLDAVAALLHDKPWAAVSTLSKPLEREADFLDPSVVKVVCQKNGAALYFSRAPIAHARDSDFSQRAAFPRGHIGVYGYRVSFLHTYQSLAPAPMENLECLEQLRALWHGYSIVVADAPQTPGPGVDTPEDLQRVQALLDRHSS